MWIMAGGGRNRKLGGGMVIRFAVKRLSFDNLVMW